MLKSRRGNRANSLLVLRPGKPLHNKLNFPFYIRPELKRMHEK
jgi:hypothetical protein